MARKGIYSKILLETLPILAGIVLAYFFWQTNILLAIFYLLGIFLLLKVKREPGDVYALIYGFILGLVVEVLGTSISGYQVFVNPDFLGIPIWLPVAWAYGLMVMKRIGVIIYQAQK